MRTAAETAEQVRKGALKATDRIKEALDAIEKHNGAINAFIRVDVRPGQLLSEMDVTIVDEHGREFDKVTYRRRVRA